MAKNKYSGEIVRFKKFLLIHGAEILIGTNPYEVIRFKANYRIGVIYKNKNQEISSFTGEACEAWECFKQKKTWSAVKVNARVRKNAVLTNLLERDGSSCFFCGKEIIEGMESLEHLLAINQGGTNHLSNLVLTHHECNRMAGSLPIIKKVELRDELRINGGKDLAIVISESGERLLTKLAMPIINEIEGW